MPPAPWPIPASALLALPCLPCSALTPGDPVLCCSTAEADIERLNKDAEVAPHVQDDFDIQASLLAGRVARGVCCVAPYRC